MEKKQGSFYICALFFGFPIAGMAELVDAHVSEACAARHVSSTLIPRTKRGQPFGWPLFLCLVGQGYFSHRDRAYSGRVI